MIEHYYPTFLESVEEYARAVRYWIDQVWDRVDCWAREEHGWRQPWADIDWESHEVFRDGNPIFSAYSQREQKAIRVIQHPPTRSDVEFEFWLDTFGGPPSDPRAIRELVISCALSDEVAERAYERMEAWVREGIISNAFRREQPVSDHFAESLSRSEILSLAWV